MNLILLRFLPGIVDNRKGPEKTAFYKLERDFQKHIMS